jgi:hypothetical protein
MTRSNRIANRLILAFIGIAALTGAALAAWPHLGVPAFPLPSADDERVLWIVIAVAAVVVALSVAWIVTRGRGHTAYAFSTSHVRIDAAVIESMLTDRLAASPDILTVRTRAFRVRTAPVLLATVQVRRHPDLGAVTHDVQAAIAHVDAVCGTRLPVIAHVTTGARTLFAGTRSTR